MSMDNAWLDRCIGCDELVFENDPILGYYMDEDRQYWHLTCYALYLHEVGNTDTKEVET